MSGTSSNTNSINTLDTGFTNPEWEALGGGVVQVYRKTERQDLQVRTHSCESCFLVNPVTKNSRHEMSGTSSNSNSINTLDSGFVDPDMEALRQKMNEIILNGRR